MAAISYEKMIAASSNPSLQELIILPTEQCNFRCDYCFEDFRIGRMPPEVVDGVVNLIARRAPDLKRLHLSWFGGEPLLASDVMLSIAEAAQRFSERHGFKLSGAVTTNGWKLGPDLLGKLLDVRQSQFQITLDGWRDGHDGTRKLASGRGTFDRIWENLLAARGVPRDFRITLRLHLTETNLASQEDLCARLAEAFADDGRFRFAVQDVRPLGGPGDAKASRLDKGEVQRRIHRLSGLLGLTAAEVDAPAGLAAPHGPDAQDYVCYASKANSLIVRADGSLAKCTVALSSPTNRIGRLNKDGTLALDDDRLRFWTRGLVSRNSAELACPAVGLPS